ncbi:GLUG motif-containing protein [Paraburkholderia sp. RL18-085-BIA-A]|uniref:GLUG motif-containing protein n=1 Tax=Paraburkholderia sp. RL18-085-BIA-A TaxID=3031633 RepID=UPI0038BA441B
MEKTKTDEIHIVRSIGSMDLIDGRSHFALVDDRFFSKRNSQLLDQVMALPFRCCAAPRKSDASVQAGLWNVSTPKFTVDSATAGAFVRSLNAGTSIDATATVTNGASGDMTVASSLDWQGPASLSLVAFRHVTIAPATTIKNTGSGNLSLRADAAGIDNAGSVANHGTIDWSKSTGIVSLLYDMNGAYSPGTLIGNAWTAPAYSGLVTQITGYRLVNSANDLQEVSLSPGGNFALGRDIEARAGVRQIGSTEAPFSGQFDGMGHKVSHLGSGLFGVVGTAGIVRNVGIVDAAYYGYGAVGFVADTNYGTVAHAYSTGTISSESITDLPGVGGLVGTNYGTVQRSWSSVGISGEGYLGGLVGYNVSGANIRESYATGSVDQFGHGGPGGLVGINEGLISASYATGNTSASSSCGDCGGYFTGGGGLAYYQTSTGRIEQSFSTGLISQYYGIPSAVVGANGGTIASNVYYDKETSRATQSEIEVNGLTTSQMSRPESFGASWDFSSNGTWAIPACETHPVLRWRLGPL